MASKRASTREELRGMKRADLQKLAKEHHIKANMKTDVLIEQISAAQAASRGGTSTLRMERSGTNLGTDGQENQPTPKTPKTADSSLGSSGDGSPARPSKSKGIQAKPAAGSGRSKLPVPDVTRGATGVQAVIPPSVVAASPNPDIKGKGRVKKPPYAAPVRNATGGRLPIAKTPSLEDTRLDARDHEMTFTMSQSTSSFEMPPPPHAAAVQSDASLIVTLNDRVSKLEHAREDSRERREKEIENLRSQLRAAEESIHDLVLQTGALKSRMDSVPVAAAQQELSDVLARLTKLEEQFGKLEFEKSSSFSSSEVDGVLLEPPLRHQFQTPPNRPEESYRGSRRLAPAAVLTNSGRRMDVPRTPPPRTRQFSTNPDISPSPTRLPKPGPIMSRPPPTSVPAAGPSTVFDGHTTRRFPTIEEGEFLLNSESVTDSPKRGRPLKKNGLGTVPAAAESDPDDSDREQIKLSKRPDSAERDYLDRDLPLAKLPHSIVPAVSAPASPLYTAPATTSRPLRTPREGSSRGTARSKPYARDSRPRRFSVDSNPEANVEDDGPQNIPDLFGATPDPTRIPPLPFVDGAMPILKLGRPSLSNSVVLETPFPSPSQPPAAMEDTPPALRTRFGTEIDTPMKAKFSE